MDNAIKYTRNGGRITVRWSAAADRSSFEVEDTGVGIPERDLPRVFERFYRVDKARSREVGRHRAGAGDRQAPGAGDEGHGPGGEPGRQGDDVPGGVTEGMRGSPRQEG